MHEYKNLNELKLPSVKEQNKIELAMLKDPSAQKEIVDSLMRKGFTRDQAVAATESFHAGKEFCKSAIIAGVGITSGGALAIATSGAGAPLGAEMAFTAGTMAFATYHDKRNKALRSVQNTIGDSKSNLSSMFETRLAEKGYNAYRDTNDRRQIQTKQAIIVSDSGKDVKQTSSRQMTKRDWAEGKVADGHITKPETTKANKRITTEDRINDAEKDYDKLLELHKIMKKTTKK